MEICIIGTGYVGLVTGGCLAEIGHQVWCVDVDENKINHLQRGVLPIYEPGLNDIVINAVNQKKLHFTNDIHKGIENASVCFICVGTPSMVDGSADLSAVVDVAGKIGRHMKQDLMIVIKSTVPVGTTAQVKEIIKNELDARGRGNVTFDVAFNPEFLKEGTAVADFMYPDRIIIGAENEETARLLRQLYQPVLGSHAIILTMSNKSAEITKYAANAMLATRISFMNEMAQLCDKVGGNIDEVRVGIGTDHRIGHEFLLAGVGYGGSCFPKDVLGLIHTGKQNGLEMSIATAVHKVNERQKSYLSEMITQYFGGNLQGRKIGIWGLAFKGQTDDMREAPAIVMIHSLLQKGAKLMAYDPAAMTQAKQIFGECSLNLQYADHMMEAVTDADALVLITDWQQFKQPDFTEMMVCMKKPVIFDGRNYYDPVHMKTLGFEYYGIGRNGNGR